MEKLQALKKLLPHFQPQNVHGVCEYIENQKEHHKTQNYAEAYEGFVKTLSTNNTERCKAIMM